MHCFIDVWRGYSAKGRGSRGLVDCPTALLTAQRRAFCPSSCASARTHCLQSRHPQQVIGSGDKVGSGLSSFYPQVAAAPKSGHGFNPAKNLFDPFANALAGLAAQALRRALIQSRDLDSLLARHMRRKGPFPAASHKSFLMVVLVRTHRLGTGAFVQQDMLVELL